MDKLLEQLVLDAVLKSNDFDSKRIQLLEAKILYFQAKYKNEMSPNLYKEYLEFFNIQRKTEGRIEK